MISIIMLVGTKITAIFYIKPLHQINKIGAPPAFDTSIDFGGYPHFIGSISNAYLNLLPGGISALLAGCFVAALIIKKIR